MTWKPRYIIQKQNVQITKRQYHVTIVTTPDDRWCVIEVYPERLKLFIHTIIEKAIGKCRLLW